MLETAGTESQNVHSEENPKLESFSFEFCLDENGIFSLPYATEGFFSIYRIDPSHLETNATAVFEKIFPEDLPSLLETLYDSAKTLKPWKYDWRIERDDQVIWLRGFSTPIKKKQSIHWYGYVEDITNTRSTEITMSLIKEQEKTLIQTMQEGIVIQDLDGKIVSANRSAEQILGLTYEQMIGLTSIDPRWQAIDENGKHLPGENHPAMVTIQTKIPIQNFVMGIRKPDGVLTWISVNTQIIYQPVTKVASQVFAVFRDITEIKNSEAALREAKQKAESADKIKSAFLANMSHEIRTPLNAILGYTDLLLEGDHSEDNKYQLNIIKNSGTLLLNIINDILDLSKIDADEMKISEFPFSLREITNRIQETASILLNKKNKNIIFKTEYDDNIPSLILGDEFRILQIILNLVNNAIKFTEKGNITLQFSILENRELTICVTDTGKGIKQENYERIFHPFQQEDFSDAREFGGTGLGLTISKKLIEKMGGTISFTSSVEKENHGTTFKISLPIKIFSNKPEPKDKNIHIISPNTRLAKNRILLAEDDKVNQLLAQKILTSAGYEITTANNGNEVIEYYAKYSYDLILMDVQMPEKTGFEATAEIRALEKSKKIQSRIPIIFLSAAAMSDDRQQGIDIGGDFYLTKPLNKNELLNALDRFSGR